MLGRGWNPARVLPEVVMPLAAQSGIYFLYPLGVSFTRSVSIGLGLCLILFICVYLYSFELMIKRFFTISSGRLSIVTIFFLICHFWILKSNQSENLHLFYGGGPNLYFYYVIPYLLNYSLIFVCLAFGPDIASWNRIKKRSYVLLYIFLFFLIFLLAL